MCQIHKPGTLDKTVVEIVALQKTHLEQHVDDSMRSWFGHSRAADDFGHPGRFRIPGYNFEHGKGLSRDTQTSQLFVAFSIGSQSGFRLARGRGFDN